MSRLDALTARFEGNSDRARAFARAVRAQFDAAPSYAQILRALQEAPGKNPSPEHVAAIIKRDLAANDPAARSPAARSPAAGSPGKRAPRRARPAADGAEGPATGGRRYARRPAGAGRPRRGPGARPGASRPRAPRKQEG